MLRRQHSHESVTTRSQCRVWGSRIGTTVIVTLAFFATLAPNAIYVVILSGTSVSLATKHVAMVLVSMFKVQKGTMRRREWGVC